MQTINCFYSHQMQYRNYQASLKLYWSETEGGWIAGKRITVTGPNFGCFSVQPLKELTNLDTLLAMFESTVRALVDERWAAEMLADSSSTFDAEDSKACKDASNVNHARTPFCSTQLPGTRVQEA